MSAWFWVFATILVLDCLALLGALRSYLLG